jgi:hypothetical protein
MTLLHLKKPIFARWPGVGIMGTAVSYPVALYSAAQDLAAHAFTDIHGNPNFPQSILREDGNV